MFTWWFFFCFFLRTSFNFSTMKKTYQNSWLETSSSMVICGISLFGAIFIFVNYNAIGIFLGQKNANKCEKEKRKKSSAIPKKPLKYRESTACRFPLSFCRTIFVEKKKIMILTAPLITVHVRLLIFTPPFWISRIYF